MVPEGKGQAKRLQRVGGWDGPVGKCGAGKGAAAGGKRSMES